MHAEERYTEEGESHQPHRHTKIVILVAGILIGWYARGFWGMVYDYRAWAVVLLTGIVLAAATAAASHSKRGA